MREGYDFTESERMRQRYVGKVSVYATVVF